ncbi:MAG TPA: hypothetical protein VEB86_14430, partial [Chryseosolibacter sp.]|nr:hypothetical protein [Chryseosolibacter sp.]
MKLWETFRYELAYQSRSYATWFYFVILSGISFLMAAVVFVDEPLAGGYFLNAPYLVSRVSLITFFFLGLLALAPFAGNAAARDVETRMHPLLYCAPVRKAVYLGGRFLGAFVLGSIIMIAIPAGTLAAAFFPLEDAGVSGPVNLSAYISTYFLLLLPNTFVAVAFMFAVAVLSRRGIVSYLIAVLFCVAVLFSWQFIGEAQKNWDLAKFTDPLGVTITQDLKKMWTPAQKNALMPGMETFTLLNRLLWLSLSLAVLASTYFLFKPAPTATVDKKSRRRKSAAEFTADADNYKSETGSVIIPVVNKSFDASTRLLQMSTIARESFMLIAKGWGWLAAACMVLFVITTGPLRFSDYYGIAELPTTGKLLEEIENLKTHGVWFIIPLLIIYYAGEFVWRERDARLNEIVGAAPIPAWASFTGKFTGLLCALLLMQLLLMIAGMIAQMQMGYYNFEIGVYLKILLGIRLIDYILLAALAFTLHVILNQKYLAHLITVMFYLSAIFGPDLGIESRLLLYGTDPGWGYSDIRGLDPYVYPWLLFKLYWAGWALLLAVVANVLWPRGTEKNMSTRWRQGIRKLTMSTKATAVVAGLIIMIAGGVIYYNTHILHP